MRLKHCYNYKGRFQTSYAAFGLGAGLILGLGAPVGGFFLSLVFSVKVDPFFYLYLLVMTPLAFSVFGYFLGHWADRLFLQKKSIEHAMAIVESQSMTDDVTGIYNHRHILEEIEREVERAWRYHRIVSGIMIDVDNFKEANDSYGHLTGDSVLRDLAKLLSGSIRKVDIIGRYGGDEFLVILPETPLAAAREVAERIQQNVRQYRFKTQRDYFRMTVSLGIFTFEDPRDFNKNTFIEKIDQAMFQAKSLGKDQIYVG